MLLAPIFGIFLAFFASLRVKTRNVGDVPKRILPKFQAGQSLVSELNIHSKIAIFNFFRFVFT